MKKLRFLAATFSALLGACTTPTQRISQRLAAIQENDRAYLVGSYAVDCCKRTFNSIYIYYKNLDDEEMGSTLDWQTGSRLLSNTLHDYIDPRQKEKGYHFCIALPAGRYEFYDIKYYLGDISYSIRKKHQFKIPFSLSAGEVVDIGKLHVTTETAKNLLGMTLPVPGVLLLTGSNSESLAAARSKCPESARSKPARTVTLAPERLNPFVQVSAQPRKIQ